MSFERPPSKKETLSPEERRENLDQMQRELVRIEKVYAEHVSTRSDLSDKEKKFIFSYMVERPEHEWGQSVDAIRFERTSEGHVAVTVSFEDPDYGNYDMDPRVIVLPKDV